MVVIDDVQFAVFRIDTQVSRFKTCPQGDIFRPVDRQHKHFIERAFGFQPVFVRNSHRRRADGSFLETMHRRPVIAGPVIVNVIVRYEIQSVAVEIPVVGQIRIILIGIVSAGVERIIKWRPALGRCGRWIGNLDSARWRSICQRDSQRSRGYGGGESVRHLALDQILIVRNAGSAVDIAPVDVDCSIEVIRNSDCDFETGTEVGYGPVICQRIGICRGDRILLRCRAVGRRIIAIDPGDNFGWS